MQSPLMADTRCVSPGFVDLTGGNWGACTGPSSAPGREGRCAGVPTQGRAAGSMHVHVCCGVACHAADAVRQALMVACVPCEARKQLRHPPPLRCACNCGHTCGMQQHGVWQAPPPLPHIAVIGELPHRAATCRRGGLPLLEEKLQRDGAAALALAAVEPNLQRRLPLGHDLRRVQDPDVRTGSMDIGHACSWRRPPTAGTGISHPNSTQPLSSPALCPGGSISRPASPACALAHHLARRHCICSHESAPIPYQDPRLSR